MYHEIGIQRLSDCQMGKLRRGKPVRVKVGSAHKIALSEQQIKQLQRNHKKGMAYTVRFDPYQLEAHGSGLLGDIAKKAKSFVQKHNLQGIVNPLISRAKSEAHKGVQHLSTMAHSKINQLQPIEGEGIIGDVLGVLGGVAKTAGLGVARKKTCAKRRCKKGCGILTDLAKTAVKSVAQKGIDMGADYLKNTVSGMGFKHIASHRRIAGRKAVKAPLKKTHGGSGGALMPAGYGGSCCGRGKRTFSGSALYPA